MLNFHQFSILIILYYLSSYGFADFNVSQSDVPIDKLSKAALDVISLHDRSLNERYDDEVVSKSALIEEESSVEKRSMPPFANVPHLQVSPNFMHSYIPNTGAGNREEITIEGIHEERLKVNVPSGVRGWKYTRYNSTDFFMAYQEHHLDIWRMRLTRDIREFVFDHRFTYCSIDTKSEGKIMNAMFYTKLVKHIEVLYFVVTIESSQNFQLRAYEVIYGECVSLMQINLRQNRPLSIGFVSSQYQSALVVLFQSNERVTQLKYTHKGHDENTKLIKVFARNPVDMETFSINGFGYIAVAQSDRCEVYRLNEFVEQHILFDTISVHGLVDLDKFRLGFNHFLGLATVGHNQHLYVWHDGSFHAKQVLKVDSVIQWNTIYMPTCRDDVIIYLLRNDPQSPVRIFLWNGQLRQFEAAVDGINSAMSHNYQVLPYSQTHFSYNHTAFVLEVDTNQKSHLITLHTRLGTVPDPTLLRGLRITDIMNKLKDRFIFQQNYMQNVSEYLGYAIRSKLNKQLKSAHLFRSLQVLDAVIVNRVNKVANIRWQNSPLTVHDLKYRINDLKDTVFYINSQLGIIESSLHDVVLRNQMALITGNKRLIGHIQISSLNATQLNIVSINRLNVQQVLSNLYRVSKPQLIRGTKHALKPIYVKSSINAQFINGIEINNQLITTHNEQQINGPIKYDSQLKVGGDLIVKGKLDNFDINKDLVFLNNVDNHVFANIIFTFPITIAHTVNALTIDEIDLWRLVQNALLKTGPQIIKSELTFTKPLLSRNIEMDGLLNGVDISAMAEHLVYVNHAANIRGRKAFILDNLYVKNDLFVFNSIDELKIPFNLFLPSIRQVITGRKNLIGNTIFNDRVIVNGLVNRLRLPEDVVQLSRNETIRGPIVFPQGLTVRNNIDARKLVDGVDISELKMNARKMYENIFRNNAVFNRDVMIGQIDVKGAVNGIYLQQIFNDAVFKGSPVHISGAKLFLAPITIKQLQVENINAVNLNDFVSTSKNETVFLKTFNNLVKFNAIQINGLIDGVDVERIYNNRISLSSPQHIFGEKHFLHDITISDILEINGTINGIRPQNDIALNSKYQEIYAPKIFKQNLFANHLNDKNAIRLRGKIDNIFINDIQSRVIKLNGHQVLRSHVVLLNCNASVVGIENDVNGIDFVKFANNIMSLSRPQTIFAPKILKHDQYFSQIISSKGLNSVKLNELNERAVHLHGLSRVRSHFTFANFLQFEKSLILNGMVNGVNLSYVARDSVLKVGNNFIKGYNEFKSGFTVNGNINAFLLNGKDLRTDLLTIAGNRTIYNKAMFAKTLNISGNVVNDGRVNEIDLSRFNKDIMKTNSINIINGNLELMSTTNIEKNLYVTGLLNGIRLNNMFNDALYLNGDQQINALKTLKSSVQFLRNLNIATINNNIFPLVIKDIVFVDSPVEQHIFSDKVFSRFLISNNDVIQSRGVVNIDAINSVLLLKLFRETIRINEPILLQSIRSFQDNAIISTNITQLFATLNGVDLLRDVIHLNEPQSAIIKGRKSFENILLLNKVNLNGLVNGLHLVTLASNTLYKNGNQYIEGVKTLPKLVEFNSDNNDIETLNGMRIPEDLISLNNDQTISSQLIFNDSLKIDHNLIINGLVSGVNVSRLENESLMKDVPQLLSAPLSFETMVFGRDVKVDEHVDNVDLSALSNDAKQFTRVVNASKDLMLSTIARHSRVTNYLYSASELSTVEIDRFILYQLLDDVYGDYIDVYGDQTFSIIESIANISSMSTIRYNVKTEMFDTIKVLKNVQFVKHKIFYVNGHQYIIKLSSPHNYNVSSYLEKDGQIVGSFGYFAYSIDFSVINSNVTLFTSFERKNGKMNLFILENSISNQILFKRIAFLDIGTETSKVISFVMNGELFIIVSRNYLTNCMIDDIGVTIYVWRNNNFKVIQRIAILNVVDVMHFVNDGKHYLAINGETATQRSGVSQSIYIFRSDTAFRCIFTLFQKLHFNNARQMIAFSFGTKHLQQTFIAASNYSHIAIWRQDGEAGFISSWSLPTKSARIMSPISVGGHLFIIVGQSHKCAHSLVFKADLRGTPLFPMLLNKINN